MSEPRSADQADERAQGSEHLVPSGAGAAIHAGSNHRPATSSRSGRGSPQPPPSSLPSSPPAAALQIPRGKLRMPRTVFDLDIPMPIIRQRDRMSLKKIARACSMNLPNSGDEAMVKYLRAILYAVLCSVRTNMDRGHLKGIVLGEDVYQGLVSTREMPLVCKVIWEFGRHLTAVLRLGDESRRWEQQHRAHNDLAQPAPSSFGAAASAAADAAAAAAAATSGVLFSVPDEAQFAVPCSPPPLRPMEDPWQAIQLPNVNGMGLRCEDLCFLGEGSPIAKEARMFSMIAFRAVMFSSIQSPPSRCEYEMDAVFTATCRRLCTHLEYTVNLYSQAFKCLSLALAVDPATYREICCIKHVLARQNIGVDVHRNGTRFMRQPSFLVPAPEAFARAHTFLQTAWQFLIERANGIGPHCNYAIRWVSRQMSHHRPVSLPVVQRTNKRRPAGGPPLAQQHQQQPVQQQQQQQPVGLAQNQPGPRGRKRRNTAEQGLNLQPSQLQQQHSSVHGIPIRAPLDRTTSQINSQIQLGVGGGGGGAAAADMPAAASTATAAGGASGRKTGRGSRGHYRPRGSAAPREARGRGHNRGRGRGRGRGRDGPMRVDVHTGRELGQVVQCVTDQARRERTLSTMAVYVETMPGVASADEVVMALELLTRGHMAVMAVIVCGTTMRGMFAVMRDFSAIIARAQAPHGRMVRVRHDLDGPVCCVNATSVGPTEMMSMLLDRQLNPPADTMATYAIFFKANEILRLAEMAMHDMAEFLSMLEGASADMPARYYRLLDRTLRELGGRTDASDEVAIDEFFFSPDDMTSMLGAAASQTHDVSRTMLQYELDDFLKLMHPLTIASKDFLGASPCIVHFTPAPAGAPLEPEIPAAATAAAAAAPSSSGADCPYDIAWLQSILLQNQQQSPADAAQTAPAAAPAVPPSLASPQARTADPGVDPLVAGMERISLDTPSGARTRIPPIAQPWSGLLPERFEFFVPGRHAVAYQGSPSKNARDPQTGVNRGDQRKEDVLREAKWRELTERQRRMGRGTLHALGTIATTQAAFLRQLQHDMHSRGEPAAAVDADLDFLSRILDQIKDGVARSERANDERATQAPRPAKRAATAASSASAAATATQPTSISAAAARDHGPLGPPPAFVPFPSSADFAATSAHPPFAQASAAASHTAPAVAVAAATATRVMHNRPLRVRQSTMLLPDTTPPPAASVSAELSAGLFGVPSWDSDAGSPGRQFDHPVRDPASEQNLVNTIMDNAGAEAGEDDAIFGGPGGFGGRSAGFGSLRRSLFRVYDHPNLTPAGDGTVSGWMV